MADDASNPDDTPVTFNIKSSADARYAVTVPLTMTVLELKQKLSSAEYADIPAERQRLIYSGRVLKDPEFLASYKIKEGNTVHLVKSAASNQRSGPSPSAPAAAGVPTNLASGTGRDPLAGLTGARYAGFAQMPNAELFGPDGGMGPPPDPDQMASMLENPAFSSQLNEALSNPDVVDQMIRSNPMLQGPMGQQARQMLQDPNFRRMMTDPETLRSMRQMRRTMPGMFGGMGGAGGDGTGSFPMPGAPDDTDATNSNNNNATNASATPGANPTTGLAGPSNPMASLFGTAGTTAGVGAGAQNPFGMFFNPAAMGMMQQAPTNSAATSTQQDPNQPTPAQTAPNPFQAAAQMFSQNPQLMTQMLSAMNNDPANPNPNLPAAAVASAPTSQDAGQTAPPFDPFRALQLLQGMGINPMGAAAGTAPAPEDTRAPEDRYATQLRQLNDMGFYEFERNVEALRRTGGSVQGAIEYLLSHV